ncbi:hypothetical protein SpCBS45565_g02604 [Spizellomyces sp. 'palustris']|nr:hypothetical protein SpCBS45565_g02604 [Spizellomyces sp. 'palustris']
MLSATTQPTPEETFESLLKLSTDLPTTSLWFQQLRQHWIAKYEEPVTDAELALGKGATFPDNDRTERLDIPALLRSQPKNVEAEFRFHEELFKKLKFTYVEQKAKEGFLKRVLDIPPKFPTDQEIEEMEGRSAEKKNVLRAKKAAVRNMREEVDRLIESVYHGHAALLEQSQMATELSDEYKQMDAELQELNARQNPRTVSIEEHEKAVEEQAAAIAELEEQVNHWRSTLEYRQSKTKAVAEEVANLTPKRAEAEACAAEALRISKSKDPKLEELGIWYKEQICLLKQLQGLKDIRHPSSSQVEIVYDVDGVSTCTLMLSFKRDAKALSGWVLDAKFADIPYPCPIADLLHTANTYFTSLDDMLSLFTREIPLRVRNLVQREKEVEDLCAEYEGASYDPEARELIVHIDATGRTFVIRIGHGYPRDGGSALEVVGVEPRMMEVEEAEDELAGWKRKIEKNKIAKLKDLVAILE